MRRTSFLAVILVLIICSLAFGAPVLDDAAKAQIDAAVEQGIARHLAPAVALVIGTKDEILYARAYGHLTYDPNSPPTSLNTLFDLASVSKAVGTTSATLLLMQDGKLSLDDPVSKYLPAFDTDDKRDIRLRHLISHISGLPSYTSAAKAEAIRTEGETKYDALIRLIASLPLKYETEEDYVYSCLNFLTLARINHEVAGKSQGEFLRERLFGPLGMTHTTYYPTPDEKTYTAPTVGGKTLLQGSVHDPLAAYITDGVFCGGNAGLFSTANDLSIFCRMILSNGSFEGREYFKPGTIDLMATNKVPLKVHSIHGTGWGRAFNPPTATKLNRGYAKAVMTHSGYTGTYVRFDRLSGTFLVCLTNRVFPDDKGGEYAMRREVLRLMLETDPVYKDVLQHVP
jgi:CubicO group peptidase (beta-lactamase class C family)